ncbi:MAG: pentapeptide repeat-containing protein [Moorea sp. SIO4G2]|nr:pentapeptide repeat-containing protein [Moorena sp. SIO4G2]
MIGLLEKRLSNTWFRVVVALIIAYSALVGLSLLQQKTTQTEQVCSSKDSVLSCLAKQLLFVCTVDNLEGFALLFGASFYILESPERRNRIIYEAWQIVDNAAATGVSTSYARVEALEVLNKYGVSMRGLDAPNADLIEIDLGNAKLHQATLNDAELTGANLTEADLNKANLAGANLRGAKLAQALLIIANLSKTDLSIADLSNADLRNADLSGANLSGADLSGANLSGTNLEGILWDRQTKWTNARGLDKAENMPDALRQQLGLA